MRIGLTHSKAGRASLGLCALSLLGLIAGSLVAPSCSDDGVQSATTGAGPVLGPGEVCTTPQASQIRVRVEPSSIVLPPCPTNPADPACVGRLIKVVVDPDVCAPTQVRFDS